MFLQDFSKDSKTVLAKFHQNRLRIDEKHAIQVTQQTRGVDPMLEWCWASVVDDGQTSAQLWANVSCLLGNLTAGKTNSGILLHDKWSNFWNIEYNFAKILLMLLLGHRAYSHSHRPHLECPMAMQENRFRNDKEIDNLNIINCVILILGA